MSNKFNLKKFRAGRKAITRMGSIAHFVGYCADAEDYPLAVFVEGESAVSRRTELGSFFVDEDDGGDLVAMQPKALGRYRVALMRSVDGSYYTVTQDGGSKFIPDVQNGFVRWLADWIDVVE